jgi:hypothetical protein
MDQRKRVYGHLMVARSAAGAGAARARQACPLSALSPSSMLSRQSPGAGMAGLPQKPLSHKPGPPASRPPTARARADPLRILRAPAPWPGLPATGRGATQVEEQRSYAQRSRRRGGARARRGWGAHWEETKGGGASKRRGPRRRPSSFGPRAPGAAAWAAAPGAQGPGRASRACSRSRGGAPQAACRRAPRGAAEGAPRGRAVQGRRAGGRAGRRRAVPLSSRRRPPRGGS